MSNNYITEAFKKMELLESEDFSLDVSGLDDLDSFLSSAAVDPDEENMEVIDLEAEAKDDLKQSYMGNIIVKCNVCQSDIFFNPDDIEITEQGTIDTDEECPYCMSPSDNFIIIGEVAPLNTETIEDDMEDDVEDDIEDTDAIDNDLEEGLSIDAVDHLRGDKRVKGVDKIRRSSKLSPDARVCGKKCQESIDSEQGCEHCEDEIEEGFLSNAFANYSPAGMVLGGVGKALGLKKDDKPEAVSEDWDWGDDEDDPLDWYENPSDEVEDIYAEAISDLGLWAEPSIQGRGGSVFIYDNDDNDVGEYDFEDECEFMNRVTDTYLKDNDRDKAKKDIQKFILSKISSDDLDEGILGGLIGGALAPKAAALAGGEVASLAAAHPIMTRLAGAAAGSALQSGVTNALMNKNESLEQECDEDIFEEGVVKDAAKMAGKKVAGKAIDSGKKALKVGAQAAVDSLKKDWLGEAIEGATIETDDETMTMSTNDAGGVVIETIPKDDFDAIEGEVIAPISDETVDEIKSANDDDAFDDIDGDDFAADDFDEDSFDGLGESYLKRCYENVNSFKTTNVALKNNQLIIEGLIGFDSGNQKSTQFIFNKNSAKGNRIKLEGYNKNISKANKAFKLNCKIKNNKLFCESLNYNYKARNELNESVRVYGTVKPHNHSLTESKRDLPIRKCLQATDIMKIMDKDPQAAVDKAIEVVKACPDVDAQSKKDFLSGMSAGSIYKKVSTLATYFYNDVPKAGR